jgi:MFS family permease
MSGEEVQTGQEGVFIGAQNPDSVEALERDLAISLKNPLSKFLYQTFASLQHRNFRFLWFGILFMSAGAWVQQVTVGWLLYDLTGSAVLLGALNGLRALPYLILGLFVGVVIDRVDRRKLLIFIQPFLIVSTFALGVLIVSGKVKIWHLFVFALISGTAWSFTQPLRQALVPSLVPPKHLTNALSLTAMGHNINKVLGPALGGILIAVVGAGGNFFVQSAAYAGVLFMVFTLQVPKGRFEICSFQSNCPGSDCHRAGTPALRHALHLPHACFSKGCARGRTGGTRFVIGRSWSWGNCFSLYVGCTRGQNQT